MRYAIVQSGSKQYKAVEGQTIEVDTLADEVGKKVQLENVLLVSEEGKIMVGKPNVDGAKVAATIVAQDKGPKISVFKYKPKIRYRVKTGHRQNLTRLMVDSIDLKGETRTKPEPKAEVAPAAKTKRVAKPKAATKSKAKKK